MDIFADFREIFMLKSCFDQIHSKFIENILDLLIQTSLYGLYGWHKTSLWKC